jgi:cbb3-type cytochrome oxidase subunit 3
MPVDSMLVTAAVVLMFVVFAAVLAWGAFQTRPKQLAQQSSAKRRGF